MPTPTTIALPLASACCTPLDAVGLTDDQAQTTARLFKALADPARVKILNLLATSPNPVCGCELTQPLGLSQPTVSHHLKSSSPPGWWSASSAAPGPTTGCHPTPWPAWPPPWNPTEPPDEPPAPRPHTLRDQVRARYAAATKLTSGQGGCGCGRPADCGCDSGCCEPAPANEPGFGAERYAPLDRDQLPDSALWPAWLRQPDRGGRAPPGRDGPGPGLGRRPRRPAERPAGSGLRARPTGST